MTDRRRALLPAETWIRYEPSCPKCMGTGVFPNTEMASALSDPWDDNITINIRDDAAVEEFGATSAHCAKNAALKIEAAYGVLSSAIVRRVRQPRGRAGNRVDADPGTKFLNLSLKCRQLSPNSGRSGALRRLAPGKCASDGQHVTH